MVEVVKVVKVIKLMIHLTHNSTQHFTFLSLVHSLIVSELWTTIVATHQVGSELFLYKLDIRLYSTPLVISQWKEWPHLFVEILLSAPQPVPCLVSVSTRSCLWSLYSLVVKPAAVCVRRMRLLSP